MASNQSGSSNTSFPKQKAVEPDLTAIKYRLSLLPLNTRQRAFTLANFLLVLKRRRNKKMCRHARLGSTCREREQKYFADRIRFFCVAETAHGML